MTHNIRAACFPDDKPSVLAFIHGTNERLAVADLGPAVAFYTRPIQELK